MSIADFNKVKKLDVASVTGTPTISRTVPLKITSGDDLTTGTGEIVLDWTNISSKSDIGVYDENDNLLDYYFESFDATAETAVIHVYKDWIRDGSTQAQIAYGNGPSDQSVASETVFDKESDLAGGWLFNEENGDALDVTSNNNDGTVYGATQDVDGVIDGAYDFDGEDDYVDIGDPIVPTGSKTISFWVNIGGLDNGDAYFVVDDEDNYNYLFYYNDDTELKELGSGANVPASLSLDTWHHIVFTYDGSLWNFYVDGNNIGADTEDDISTGTKTLFGLDSASSGYFNPQKMDDMRIVSSEFSADEIIALYNATKFSPDFFSQQAGKTRLEEYTETLNVKMISNVEIIDIVSVAEDIEVTIPVKIDITDDMWFTSVIQIRAPAEAQIIDNSILEETINTQTLIETNIIDNFMMIEKVNVSAQVNVNVVETFSATESIDILALNKIIITDQMQFTSVIQIREPTQISVKDIISSSEIIAVQDYERVYIDAVMSIFDELQILLQIETEIIDTLSAIEMGEINFPISTKIIDTVSIYTVLEVTNIKIVNLIESLFIEEVLNITNILVIDILDTTDRFLFIKYWNGTQWFGIKDVKVWNGSEWIKVNKILKWNGQEWVLLS